jgi:hypothetical protein
METLSALAPLGPLPIRWFISDEHTWNTSRERRRLQISSARRRATGFPI